MAAFFQSARMTKSPVCGSPSIFSIAFVKTMGLPSRKRFALPLPMIRRGTPAHQKAQHATDPDSFQLVYARNANQAWTGREPMHKSYVIFIQDVEVCHVTVSAGTPLPFVSVSLTIQARVQLEQLQPVWATYHAQTASCQGLGAQIETWLACYVCEPTALPESERAAMYLVRTHWDSRPCKPSTTLSNTSQFPKACLSMCHECFESAFRKANACT
jgi:hypothetical protein